MAAAEKPKFYGYKRRPPRESQVTWAAFAAETQPSVAFGASPAKSSVENQEQEQMRGRGKKVTGRTVEEDKAMRAARRKGLPVPNRPERLADTPRLPMKKEPSQTPNKRVRFETRKPEQQEERDLVKQRRPSTPVVPAAPAALQSTLQAREAAAPTQKERERKPPDVEIGGRQSAFRAFREPLSPIPQARTSPSVPSNLAPSPPLLRHSPVPRTPERAAVSPSLQSWMSSPPSAAAAAAVAPRPVSDASFPFGAVAETLRRPIEELASALGLSAGGGGGGGDGTAGSETEDEDEAEQERLREYERLHQKLLQAIRTRLKASSTSEAQLAEAVGIDVTRLEMWMENSALLPPDERDAIGARVTAWAKSGRPLPRPAPPPPPRLSPPPPSAPFALQQLAPANGKRPSKRRRLEEEDGELRVLQEQQRTLERQRKQRQELEIQRQRQQEEALAKQRRQEEALAAQRQREEALARQRQHEEALAKQRRQEAALAAQLQREEEFERHRKQAEALARQRQREEEFEKQRKQQRAWQQQQEEALERQRRQQMAWEQQQQQQQQRAFAQSYAASAAPVDAFSTPEAAWALPNPLVDPAASARYASQLPDPPPPSHSTPAWSPAAAAAVASSSPGGSADSLQQALLLQMKGLQQVQQMILLTLQQHQHLSPAQPDAMSQPQPVSFPLSSSSSSSSHSSSSSVPRAPVASPPRQQHQQTQRQEQQQVPRPLLPLTTPPAQPNPAAGEGKRGQTLTGRAGDGPGATSWAQSAAATVPASTGQLETEGGAAVAARGELESQFQVGSGPAAAAAAVGVEEEEEEVLEIPIPAPRPRARRPRPKQRSAPVPSQRRPTAAAAAAHRMQISEVEEEAEDSEVVNEAGSVPAADLGEDALPLVLPAGLELLCDSPPRSCRHRSRSGSRSRPPEAGPASRQAQPFKRRPAFQQGRKRKVSEESSGIVLPSGLELLGAKYT